MIDMNMVGGRHHWSNHVEATSPLGTVDPFGVVQGRDRCRSARHELPSSRTDMYIPRLVSSRGHRSTSPFPSTHQAVSPISPCPMSLMYVVTSDGLGPTELGLTPWRQVAECMQPGFDDRWQGKILSKLPSMMIDVFAGRRFPHGALWLPTTFQQLLNKTPIHASCPTISAQAPWALTRK